MPTENHDLRQPPRGQENWDRDWYYNFDAVDELIEIRDTEANRTDYTPFSGAKYHATDTQNVFFGTGSGWRKLESFGRNPNFGSVTADTVTVENAPKLGNEVVRLRDIDEMGLGGGDGGGGGGSASGFSAGVGGEYTAVADGTTTEFRWDTGIDVTNTEIDWVTVDPTTEGASTDFSRRIVGSEIVLTYYETPNANTQMGWYWRATTADGSAGGKAWATKFGTYLTVQDESAELPDSATHASLTDETLLHAPKTHGTEAHDATVPSTQDLANHEIAAGGVHGIADTDSVAAQSEVDTKAPLDGASAAALVNYAAVRTGELVSDGPVTLDGVRFWIQPTEPTEAATGDVWIETSA